MLYFVVPLYFVVQPPVANKLSVHYVDKTQYILFIPQGKIKQKPPEFSLFMGGNLIEQTSSYKYLGVMIDEKLNWKPQIDKMCSKLSSVCGVLSKVRHYLDRNSLMLIYNSLVESRLRYGVLSWGTASNQQLNRLRVLQNKALRFITFSDIDTAMLPIYHKLKVLPLSNLITLQQASFMYSFENKLLPTTLQTYFVKPTHRYTTRYAKMNYTLQSKNSRFSESLMQVIGPRIWASIPEDLKKMPFRKTFTKQLKHDYLERLPKKMSKNKKFVRSSQVSPGEINLEELFETDDPKENFQGFDVSLNTLFNSTWKEDFPGFEISLHELFKADDSNEHFQGF